MMRWIFLAVLAVALYRFGTNWRRIVGLTLVGTITITLIFPAPVLAQFGVIGAIRNVLNVINGAIRTALGAIDRVTVALNTFYQEAIWPLQLINRARTAIAGLIAQFRGTIDAIYTEPVGSATLPTPATLEAIIRNRQVGDFGALGQSYYETFGNLPAADEADPTARNMIDIDDGLALHSFKTLKATDQGGDLILEAGNRIEDEARLAAPGSAPFLTAAAMAANIQSQAMMQKMLATMLRQEAARLAHDNAERKRHGALVVKIRQSISDVLRRP
jgi:hypothetical protein